MAWDSALQGARRGKGHWPKTRLESRDAEGAGLVGKGGYSLVEAHPRFGLRHLQLKPSR